MPTTTNPATGYTTQNGIVPMARTTEWIMEISIFTRTAVRFNDRVVPTAGLFRYLPRLCL